MELTLKTDLNVDQALFYLTSDSKNVYAPCKVCNNERKVTALVGDQPFLIDCPKCSHKMLKGDTSRVIEIQRYDVNAAFVTGFSYGRSRYGDGEPVWRVATSHGDRFDPITMIQDRGYSKTLFFTDRAAAQAKVKELNRAENAKRTAFLKGLMGGGLV